jgi:hypothetical protein
VDGVLAQADTVTLRETVKHLAETTDLKSAAAVLSRAHRYQPDLETARKGTSVTYRAPAEPLAAVTLPFTFNDTTLTKTGGEMPPRA